MKRTAEHSPILEVTESGSVIQSGSTSAFKSIDSTAYAGVKTTALSFKGLLQSHGLQSTASVSITKLIDDAIELADAWARGDSEKIPFDHLLSAAQIERISTAALSLGNCDNPKAILEGLLSGNINLLERKQSKAKDTLWELELLRILLDHKIDARIGEPDLAVRFDGAIVGMACKKIYSELNFSKTLSNAVAQIERNGDFGIVALNIDDLLPENALLKAETIDAMSARLAERNNQFLREHERYLRKYLTPGRAISVLVSCAAIADVTNAKNRFMNARETTIWHIPGMPEAKARQMANFFQAMNALYAA